MTIDELKEDAFHRGLFVFDADQFSDIEKLVDEAVAQEKKYNDSGRTRLQRLDTYIKEYYDNF